MSPAARAGDASRSRLANRRPNWLRWVLIGEWASGGGVRRLALVGLGLLFFCWIVLAGAALRPYSAGERDVRALSPGDRAGLALAAAPLGPAVAATAVASVFNLPPPMRLLDGSTGAAACGMVDAGLVVWAVGWWRGRRARARTVVGS